MNRRDILKGILATPLAGVIPKQAEAKPFEPDYYLTKNSPLFGHAKGFQVWGLTGNWGVLAAICGLDIDGDFPIEQYPFLISLEAEDVSNGASIWYSVSEFSNPRQCSTRSLRDWLLGESGCPNPETDLNTDWDAFAEWTEENNGKILEWLERHSEAIEPIRKDTL